MTKTRCKEAVHACNVQLALIWHAMSSNKNSHMERNKFIESQNIQAQAI